MKSEGECWISLCFTLGSSFTETPLCPPFTLYYVFSTYVNYCIDSTYRLCLEGCMGRFFPRKESVCLRSFRMADHAILAQVAKTEWQQQSSVGVEHNSDSIHFCHHNNRSDFLSFCPGTEKSRRAVFCGQFFMAFPGTSVRQLFQNRSASLRQLLMPPPCIGLQQGRLKT